jgi:hypothetical protein
VTAANQLPAVQISTTVKLLWHFLELVTLRLMLLLLYSVVERAT